MSNKKRLVKIITPESSKEIVVDQKSDWQKVVEFIELLIDKYQVLILKGDLGVGKTTLTQFLLKSLGVKKNVTSPTFALLKYYKIKSKTRKRFLHLDAYRIEDENELLALDLDDELIDKETFLVIEWPEKIKNWLTRYAKKIIIEIDFIEDREDV